MFLLGPKESIKIDNKVPPELVKPWTIPIVCIKIFFKFLFIFPTKFLNLYLEKIENKINIETIILKFISELKKFIRTIPKKIPGKQ
tara:strand:- start:29 stop:286 length:258 start_codon:yes stop_codon:yes gene_type:complete